MKRRTVNAKKRADKNARKERMRAAGLTTGEKSKYARKVARKRGRGAIESRWMWWMEPRRDAVTVPTVGPVAVESAANSKGARS